MFVTAGGGGSAEMDYDFMGRMSSAAYPNSGPTFGYVDVAGRLVNMMQSPCNPYYDGSGLQCGSTIATATYTASGQIATLAWDGVSESRTYNNLNQMTRITTNGWVGSGPATYQTIMDMQYIFPSGSNNGQVSQTIDGVTGETVNYTYDALNRLTSAATTSTLWGNSYAYDGFSNLTDMTVTKGSAPALSLTFNAATNQPTGYTFDANGLSTGSVAAPVSWDMENRMITSPLGNYVYDPSGKRVESYGSSPTYYFYGLGGKETGGVYLFQRNLYELVGQCVFRFKAAAAEGRDVGDGPGGHGARECEWGVDGLFPLRRRADLDGRWARKVRDVYAGWGRAGLRGSAVL